MHLAEFMKHPRLTDVGVYFLVALQHSRALVSAFISSVAFRTRSALSDPGDFFRQSPALLRVCSLCWIGIAQHDEILLLAGVGLRMVMRIRRCGWSTGCLPDCVLFCSILTRHINLVLAGLVPLTFLLFGLASRFSREELKGEVFVPSYPVNCDIFRHWAQRSCSALSRWYWQADILTSFAGRSASKCAR